MKKTLPLWGLSLAALALLAAACAPQKATIPTQGAPPLTIQEIPTPTPAPVALQGEAVTVGFNIRGWT